MRVSGRRMPVIPETAGSTAMKTLGPRGEVRRDGGMRTEIDVAQAAPRRLRLF